MPELCITAQNIEKIGHPMKEIRERALLSLYSKLEYDYVFDDNLNRSSELLKLLFNWFRYEECNYQDKVLKLLLSVIKSPSGNILIKHYGCKRLLQDLNNIESKVDPCNMVHYNPIVEYLTEQQTLLNDESINVPELDLPRSMESFVDVDCTSDASTHYKSQTLYDKENSPQEVGKNPSSGDNIMHLLDATTDFDLSSQGIKIYLLPWCNMCDSDINIIKMVEDTFIMDESTKKTINFFSNILLRDFPAELFLNRPYIINNLLKMLNNPDKCEVALEALRNVYKAIYRRLFELKDPDLRHQKKSPNYDMDTGYLESREYHDEISSKSRQQRLIKLHVDGEEALKQMPLPLLCLETIYIVINCLGEYAVQPLTSQHRAISYTMHEINEAISLCFDACKILYEIIKSNMWDQQQTNPFIEKIYQKTVIVMRSLGDVLKRFRLSFATSQTKDASFRVAYLRLLSFGIFITRWCDYTPLIPSSFTSSLYEALFDASCMLLYVDLHTNLKNVIQNFHTSSVPDKEKLNVFMDCESIYNAMNSSVNFIQNYSTLCENPNIVKLIHNSLPALAFHLNMTFIARVMDVFSVKYLKWKQSKSTSDDIRFITLNLLAHSDQTVRETFYTMVHSLVGRILGGDGKDMSYKFNEDSLQFLLHSSILIEIASHGIESSSKKVQRCAKDIIQYMLRGKLLLSNKSWRRLLEALIPALPFIHVHADHNDAFGNAVIKTLDLKISEQMLIPKIDVILGNIRLLYTKCFTAQMEGASNICQLLNYQDGADTLLPKIDSIRPDSLCSAIRPLPPSNFNIIKHNDAAFYEKGSLLQVLSLLSNSVSHADTGIDYAAGGDAGSIDPSFRRSALAQIAVMLQQPTLHESFLTNNGCKIITHYLRASLTTHEYTSFPESAISCVTIFNILSYSNSSIRQWFSEQQDIILNTIRALLVFPNDEGFSTTVSQLLGLLVFAQVTNNTPGFSSSNRENFSGLSVHHCIAKNVNLPYPYETYSQTSAHQRCEKVDLLMKDEMTSSFLRICWCCAWYGGVDNVVRWPYLPDNSEHNEYLSNSLMITNEDLTTLKMTCCVEGCVVSLYQIQNATSHKAVNSSLDMLSGYMLLVNDSIRGIDNLDHLPWQETMSRFTKSIPASPKDSALLLNVIKCISTYVIMLTKHDCENLTLTTWLHECIFDTSSGITSLLKQHKFERNWTNDDIDQTPNNLRQAIINLICEYSILVKKWDSRLLHKGDRLKCGDLVEFLITCLLDVEIYNHYSLAFIGQILKCLSHLVVLPCDNSTSSMNFLIQSLSEILTISFVGDGYEGYKNYDLIKNSFIILCQVLQSSLSDETKMKVWVENCVQDNRDRSILSTCLLWHNSSHLMLRSLSFKLLAGLCTQPAIISHLYHKFDDANQNLMEIVVSHLLDNSEASLYREQVAVLLSNLLSSKLARHLSTKLFDAKFFNQISSTVSKLCLDDVEEYDTDNISLEVLSNREALQVAYSKDEFTIPILLSSRGTPKCSIKLLTSFTDVIYNYILYAEKIPDCLVQSEILRFLFRCIILKVANNKDKFSMIAAVCRLLHRAVNMSLHVHSTIVSTEDCVNALFDLFSSQYVELHVESSSTSNVMQEMWKWSLSLIGSIAETKNGFKLLWKLLLQSGMSNFFRIILLGIRDSEYKEMLPSVLFCLVNLLSSHILYAGESDHVIMIQNILNETPTSSLNVKSSVNNSVYQLRDYDSEVIEEIDVLNTKSVKFDAKKTILEDAVLGEDLCDTILIVYKSFYNTCKNVSFPSVNENPCYSVVSCLCGLFATSNKAQLYAVEKGFVQDQIKTLCELHYSVAAEVKASDLMRKTSHPSLLKLDWTIQMLCNIMTNCPQAKNQCVESGIIVPLNKMWPWCISTIELRQHTIQLICVYTNNCPKANQSMHTTVGVKSLLLEVIDLVDKEMNLVSRQRSLAVLRGCLQILENTSSHVHCRAIILKSDLLSHLNKLHPAVTKRQPQWREVESMWESLIISLSRYPEGQLRVAEYFGAMCALIHQAQGLMLPVLGNCAFNPFNRPRILGSAEVLNIFSSILQSNNNLQDILIVCGALWALGANHHKSKLALKTAGLTSKLSECLQKLKYDSRGYSETERAIQIITYVLKIITIL